MVRATEIARDDQNVVTVLGVAELNRPLLARLPADGGQRELRDRQRSGAGKASSAHFVQERIYL
jgi:hypothetical protein